MHKLLNKKVVIYPGDTQQKEGIIKDIIESGVLFLITKGDGKNFVEGKKHFIAFSANLTFREI